MMCESSCSDAVLQSGARWVGVGLGAGVGGRIDEFRASGLEVSVSLRDDRDRRLCLRVARPDEEEAMSVSLSMIVPACGFRRVARVVLTGGAIAASPQAPTHERETKGRLFWSTAGIPGTDADAGR